MFTEGSIAKAVESTGCRPPALSYAVMLLDKLKELLSLSWLTTIGRKQRGNELGWIADSRHCVFCDTTAFQWGIW